MDPIRSSSPAISSHQPHLFEQALENKKSSEVAQQSLKNADTAKADVAQKGKRAPSRKPRQLKPEPAPALLETPKEETIATSIKTPDVQEEPKPEPRVLSAHEKALLEAAEKREQKRLAAEAKGETLVKEPSKKEAEKTNRIIVPQLKTAIGKEPEKPKTPAAPVVDFLSGLKKTEPKAKKAPELEAPVTDFRANLKKAADKKPAAASAPQESKEEKKVTESDRKKNEEAFEASLKLEPEATLLEIQAQQAKNSIIKHSTITEELKELQASIEVSARSTSLEFQDLQPQEAAPAKEPQNAKEEDDSDFVILKSTENKETEPSSIAPAAKPDPSEKCIIS